MQTLLTFSTIYPEVALAFLFIFGLMVGSFLNVVIYRLPVMMERQWKNECQLILSDNPDAKPEPPSKDDKFNLAWPPSRCPSCQHKIRAWENIPVISWLFLRGKCSSCSTPISVRYPLIELLTGLLSVWIGFAIFSAANTDIAADTSVLFTVTCWLLLIWGLIAITFIDLDHMYIPDSITLPLIWLGLFLSTLGNTISPGEAIIGTMVGYLSLWSIYHVFKLLTGKEGMGYGDFKLLAVFGAWAGWQVIPLTILLSSFVGAAFGIVIIIRQKKGKDLQIPFGPYLAIAGFISLFWGEQIINYYVKNFLYV